MSDITNVTHVVQQPGIDVVHSELQSLLVQGLNEGFGLTHNLKLFWISLLLPLLFFFNKLDLSHG